MGETIGISVSERALIGMLETTLGTGIMGCGRVLFCALHALCVGLWKSGQRDNAGRYLKRIMVDVATEKNARNSLQKMFA